MRNKGWTKTQELQVGDEVRLLEPGWAIVEGVSDTGRLERVYNLEIEGDHTYFVGCPEWGFAVWAHNLGCDLETLLTQHGLDEAFLAKQPWASLTRVTQGVVRVALSDNPTAQVAAGRIARSLEKRLGGSGVGRSDPRMSDLVEAALQGRYTAAEAAEAAAFVRMTEMHRTAPVGTVSPAEFLTTLRNGHGQSTTDHMLGWVSLKQWHTPVSGVTLSISRRFAQSQVQHVWLARAEMVRIEVPSKCRTGATT